ETLGDELAIQLDELRLEIEQLELARAAGHEKENHVLGLRPEMAGLRLEGVRQRFLDGERFIAAHERSQGNGAEAHAAAAEEMAAGEGGERVVRIRHLHRFIRA